MHFKQRCFYLNNYQRLVYELETLWNSNDLFFPFSCDSSTLNVFFSRSKGAVQFWNRAAYKNHKQINNRHFAFRLPLNLWTHAHNFVGRFLLCNFQRQFNDHNAFHSRGCQQKCTHWNSENVSINIHPHKQRWLVLLTHFVHFNIQTALFNLLLMVLRTETAYSIQIKG